MHASFKKQKEGREERREGGREREEREVKRRREGKEEEKILRLRIEVDPRATTKLGLPVRGWVMTSSTVQESEPRERKSYIVFCDSAVSPRPNRTAWSTQFPVLRIWLGALTPAGGPSERCG